LLEPLHGASYVLIALSGKDVLLVAQGRFDAPPVGAVLLTPKLALAGSPQAIAAARQKHAQAALAAYAAPLEAQDVWAVVSGRYPLPLSGNWENINRLLRLTDYTTVTARLGADIEADIHGHSPTTESARELEETTRAILSLAATTSRDTQWVSLLRSIRVERDGGVVHVTLTVPRPVLEGLTK
jgi:hypothetical protein